MCSEAESVCNVCGGGVEPDNELETCKRCDFSGHRMCIETHACGMAPPEDQFSDDVEADADALKSAGLGTDEDYGGDAEHEG